ncbi:amidohydrolase family protein [Seongchinamella unica]|uniref:Amidohydrolase family protein n=1 Tax=Seongchinamella unica TaxID=2547392 RepID=A0A4V2ZX11_9GAMM|nr:amidohydrolase family protein [Seongchinamella unica]TDG12433.1 amidohydrolase family protein [Seongchinamella unica]
MKRNTHDKRRHGLIGIVLLCFVGIATAQDSRVVLTNVHVFDGVSEKRIENANVLIEGNLIKRVTTDALDINGATTIDGGGRTLIPGLIDAHWHTTYAYAAQSTVITGDISEIAIRGALGAEKTLMRGFTTTRDTGGNPFSIKKMIDAGELVGPRILPSGPPLSQTSGHLDYRSAQATPTNPGDSLDYWNANLLMLVADGVPELLKRTREILRAGATQIKFTAGGGVSSVYDPIDVTEYTFEEMKAIVDVANTWNTYVLAHVFTDAAAQQAIRAGVKSLEHGMLFSEETLRMMKKNDVWLSTQPILNDDQALKFDDPKSNAKFIEVTQGTENLYPLAKKIGVKIAFGTDMLFDPVTAEAQTQFLTKLKPWFTPYEILKMATHDNAQLLELAGPRHPYQDGPLGEIVEGAYADLILVDGNPLENIDLLADPHQNFVLIMKDGEIFKNTL